VAHGWRSGSGLLTAAGALSLAVFASMAPAADSGTTTEQFMIPRYKKIFSGFRMKS
jgi:hypothetical protein